jgi:hypothetical protein
MDVRELKAPELAARAKITWDGGAWLVPSQSGNTPYRVTTWPDAESCTCDDFALRQSPCKHIIAARLVEERDGRRQAPPIDTDTAPERKTYSQNWPLYNLAQSVEKDRLQVLLAELCRGVPEPPDAGTGRRPIPVADRFFAAAFKVYSTVPQPVRRHPLASRTEDRTDVLAGRGQRAARRSPDGAAGVECP